MNTLSIVILAAGLGSRMKSELPKPLHKIGGKPMLSHVLESARKLNPDRLIVVYGHRGEVLKEAYQNEEDITWVEQKSFEGTGDAMRYALPSTLSDSKILVLYGDTPLINHETLAKLTELVTPKTPLAWLTSVVDDPTGYGRIIRDHNNEMVAIIEEKDANENERAICEMNTGIFVTTEPFLQSALPQLNNDNQQEEYYLTDIAKIAVEEELPILTLQENPQLILGVNDRVQLAELEAVYQQKRAEELMRNGVTLDRPETLTIKGQIKNGMDCHIAANVTLSGNIILGRNVTIEAGVILKDVVIGDNSTIRAYSVIEGAKIGTSVSIGPFARLREGSDINDHAHIGNFVETKNTQLGEGSKVGHLTYLGDASIGDRVNVGAGVITCNYDGANKFNTRVEDDVFIGSHNSLVAPVTLKKGATTAAGAIITKDIEAEELALNTIELKRIPQWKRPKKEK